MSYGFLQRWRPSVRSAVVESDVPAHGPFRLADVARGWRVYDVSGSFIGPVAGVTDSDITVSRGLFRGSVRMPTTWIAEVRGRALRLNVTSERALERRRTPDRDRRRR